MVKSTKIIGLRNDGYFILDLWLVKRAWLWAIMFQGLIPIAGKSD